MVDNGLKGIGVGRTQLRDGDPENNVEKLLEQLEVGDLNDFSEEQLAALDKVFGEVEELEGISQDIERGDRGRRERERQAIQQSEVERDNIFEAQLTELENIGTDTELLQRIAAELATTNNLLGITNSLLRNIIETTSKAPRLIPKDANQIEFRRAQDARDVVEDNDISTSTILVKTNPQNDGDLFVGEENVKVGGGYRLEAGERQIFQINVLDGAFQIVAESSGDTYTYISLGRV